MIKILNKIDCCGCEACAQKCPQNAIEMKADDEGFLYPVILLDKCVKCNLCNIVCPINNAGNKNSIIKSYALQNVNDDIRRISTAGGAFYSIAEEIIKRKGIVFGAILNTENFVVHASAENVKELEPLCMSKYVQSHIKNTYKEVKRELDSGRIVCFVGTPCQCEGLFNFCGRTYENLFLIDFLCHGVPSPKVWKKYVNAMRDKYNAINFKFRAKDKGYNDSRLKFMDKKGDIYFSSNEDKTDINFMLDSFFAEIASRPCCHSCCFKTVDRVSDFTLGDLWSIGEFNLDMDDNKGTTFVSTRTIKANELLKGMDTVRLFEIPLDRYIKKDGINLVCSMTANTSREKYFQDIDELDIDELSRKYLKKRKNRGIYFIKCCLDKIGLLHIVKKLKYAINEYIYKYKTHNRRERHEKN